jgi:hypothetical protein
MKDKVNSVSVNFGRPNEKLEKLKLFFAQGRRNVEVERNMSIKISADFEANRDIFYRKFANHITFSYDPIDLTEVNLNEINSQFILKSYSESGKTPIDDLYRLKPSCEYIINLDGIHEVVSDFPIHSTDDSLFKILQTRLKQEIKYVDFVGIFFSGGVDSLSLALCCKQLSIPFKLYIGREIPNYASNLEDVQRAISVAETAGWAYCVVDVDYRKINLSTVAYLQARNPFSPHFGALFHACAEQMQHDNVTVALSGQNLDNLLNFGLTDRWSLNFSGLVGAMRRYYLTDFYLKSFNSSLINKMMARAGGAFGLFAYSVLKRSFVYRQPSSLSECVRTYLKSAENVVFSRKDYQYKNEEFLDSVATAREYLLLERIDAYCMSGPALTIHGSCEQFKIRCLLPYSFKECLSWYASQSSSFFDIFKPKKELYGFVKMLDAQLYSSAFEKTYKADGKPYHEWVEADLIYTTFGRQLSERYRFFAPEGYTSAITISMALADYWVSQD